MYYDTPTHRIHHHDRLQPQHSTVSVSAYLDTPNRNGRPDHFSCLTIAIKVSVIVIVIVITNSYSSLLSNTHNKCHTLSSSSPLSLSSPTTITNLRNIPSTKCNTTNTRTQIPRHWSPLHLLRVQARMTRKKNKEVEV